MIKAGIIGVTGFTGSELVRILYHHPNVEIEFMTSESKSGEEFQDIHTFFHDILDMKLCSIKDIHNFKPDVVFLALPHGVSMEFVKENSRKNFRIIDLSGDFRLRKVEDYEHWYGKKHLFPDGLSDAVFGLPELFREQIERAKLIANPGCYPTSAILGSAPLISKNLANPKTLIVDSKSGVTGAGVKPGKVNMFSNVNENFKAYGLKNHRHTIEIQSILNTLAGDEVLVQFTPHLLPVDRGILTTLYAQPQEKTDSRQLQEFYREFYRNAPFVRIRKEPPGIKDVRGSNFCDIFPEYDERTNRILIISVIDNLVKGASGQAVQNMNLMFDIEETTGLNHLPLLP